MEHKGIARMLSLYTKIMEIKMSYKNLKSDFDKKYAEIIRVNQAGEFGAKRIYEDIWHY